MSNARVPSNIKEQDSIDRRGPASSDALATWSGSPAVSRWNASLAISQDRKISSRMPLLRLNRVIAFVDANITRDLCVPRLATVAGMSLYYFCRSFKQSTGITPHRYVLHRRMEQAKRLLGDGAVSLLQVAHEVGFTDQSQFTRVFHKIVGTTPSNYRKKALSN